MYVTKARRNLDYGSDTVGILRVLRIPTYGLDGTVKFFLLIFLFIFSLNSEIV